MKAQTLASAPGTAKVLHRLIARIACLLGAAAIAGSTLAIVLAVSAAPAGATTYGTQQTVPFGSDLFLTGLTADGAGDVFATDYWNGQVLEVAKGSTTQTVLPFTGLYRPTGVAVDAAGDVFVTDMGHDRVLELAKGSTTQTVLPFTGLSYPWGVAVDSAGDVFVADSGNDRVLELAAGSTTESVLPFTGLDEGNGIPAGVAVDAAGDVFTTDWGNHRVLELANGATAEAVMPFSGFDQPDGVAVDSAGDVFAANNISSGGGQVLELANGAATQTVLPFTGLQNAFGVAVDSAGDVFAANDGNNSVLELPVPIPTTTALSVTPSPVVYGQAVTVVAEVSPDTSGSGSPTGTVTFTDGAISLGSATLNGSSPDVATLKAVLAAGTNSLTASYSGDRSFISSSGNSSEVVDQAPLTVAAPSPTMTYGGSLPALTPRYSGFVAGDSSSSLAIQATCSTSATSYSPVGNYPVACSGANDPNYSFTYTGGSLSIDPAPLTVSAPSPTTTYGSAIPALDPTYSGFVDGNTSSSLSSQATCTTSASRSSPVGTYPVTCSGANDPNYSFSYVAGALTIAKAPLTVTANDATRFYEAPNPAFAPSYSGFVLGQDFASSGVSGSPSCSTAATGSSPPGTYPITCATGTLVARNYSFAFMAGTLTVTKAPTTISATPALLSLSPFGADLLTLHAMLTSEVTKAGLPGEPVVFMAGSTVLCRAVTSSSGSATCDVLADPAGLPAMLGANGYQVTYSGSTDYLPSSTSAPLVGT